MICFIIITVLALFILICVAIKQSDSVKQLHEELRNLRVELAYNKAKDAVDASITKDEYNGLRFDIMRLYSWLQVRTGTKLEKPDFDDDWLALIAEEIDALCQKKQSRK